jgi:putative transposase
VLVDLIAKDCDEIIRKISTDNKMDILSMEVMPDHVHVFLTAPPKLSPHIIVKRLKGASAVFLRNKYPQLKRTPCMWAASYYVGTVGSVSESVVKMYIEGQKGK